MHQLCTSAHLIYSCVEVVVSRTQLELNHGSRVTSKASVLLSFLALLIGFVLESSTTQQGALNQCEKGDVHGRCGILQFWCNHALKGGYQLGSVIAAHTARSFVIRVVTSRSGVSKLRC